MIKVLFILTVTILNFQREIEWLYFFRKNVNSRHVNNLVGLILILKTFYHRKSYLVNRTRQNDPEQTYIYNSTPTNLQYEPHGLMIDKCYHP